MIEPTAPNPQLSAATALAQLLTEHPELPAATWSIGRETGTLRGTIHDDETPFESLGAYAHVLDGSIRAGFAFEVHRQELRSHELRATWRDVRVQVDVYVPLAVSDRYLGLLAEQQHQYVDLDADATCRTVVDFKAAA